MPSKAPAAKQPPNKPSPKPSKPVQTTLVPTDWGKKKGSANGAKRPKFQPRKPNGNIISFFQKAEELNNQLFYDDKRAKGSSNSSFIEIEDDSPDQPDHDVNPDDDIEEKRYNEVEGSLKKRRISGDSGIQGCTPPPPDNSEADKTNRVSTISKPPRAGPFVDESDSEADELEPSALRRHRPSLPELKQHEAAAPRDLHPSIDTKESKPPVKVGPFVDESDSEMDETVLPTSRRPFLNSSVPKIIEQANPNVTSGTQVTALSATHRKPLELRPEVTSATSVNGDDFNDFGDVDDEDLLEGEENEERRWMEEQRRLEEEEGNFHGESGDFDAPPLFPSENQKPGIDLNEEAVSSCPICNTTLAGFSEQDALVHVNTCLDGGPPTALPVDANQSAPKMTSGNNSKIFKKADRPAKPGQANPFQLGESSKSANSAFSKLMANHTEDAAWATAAASEAASRGKPSYQRTCPFYKILPGFYICVDAFRYGAVEGQKAYFLSHFHSDHYVGLTSSWSHGPIYCSKATGNLVRQQLHVDPKWVVDLDWERKTEVPGTQGVHVTMIPANHCPGSSLFLFEKEGKNSRMQRVLHCGDFRACRAHIEHPLLRPEVLDVVSGKNRQQKIDVCYLDTTYLNPKYAFPPQEHVIQACADMCVSLNKIKVDDSDDWEKMKRERAGEGMAKFVRKDSSIAEEHSNADDPTAVTEPNGGKGRGRLLVVVGTYSIGKERICLGIARALNSKIYASASKTRICHALEDPELNALLTRDPHEAQVHMTPLFEIRPDTLEDYLRDYREYFFRAVAFRPSGWNYRPPNSRFMESPTVQSVLHSQNWKSAFSLRDLVPQRGSTSRASCFGVPYSEHSSFRELTMFCCALRIDRIIPTVNVGKAATREKMKAWCDKWAADKKKHGLFRLQEDGSGW